MQDDTTAAEMARRLDGFVDAAFAFAVTLVIVSTTAPTSLGELAQALGRIPSAAASFALIVMFWLGYRNVSRLFPVRDALTTTLSLALVLLVLVYVFPLRIMFETVFHLVSGGRLPGGGLTFTSGDFRFLYTVYGLGFGALAALFSALYALALRRRNAPPLTQGARADAHDWMICWMIMIAAAILSTGLALMGPVASAPWLPGMVYMLIPIAIGGYVGFSGAKPKPPETTP